MKNSVNSGAIIAGFTLLGMGIGYLTHNMKAFMFIGIGLGLLVSYFLRTRNKKSSDGDEG